MTPRTLPEIVRQRAKATPERRIHSFYGADGKISVHLDYATLDRRACGLASIIAARAKPGSRVLVLYPTGPDMVVAMFACFYAGVVPVPLAPPHAVQLERALERMKSVERDAQAGLALTTSAFRARVEQELSIPCLATDNIETPASAFSPVACRESDTAFLQYTSGSTSDPKGVVVTHGAVVANLIAIQQMMQIDADSRIVSWTPIYHDMGLVSSVFAPVLYGCECLTLSTLDFLQHPARWLRAISDFKATMSGGPNFAYDLCLARVSEAQLKELDLSTWRVAFNGAEPVRRETLERFSAKFEQCGFRAEAFFPCYGMSEVTLFITGGHWKTSADTEPTVSCGVVAEGHAVEIVDPETHSRCPEGKAGEIWIAGPSLADRYLNLSGATAHSFGARISGVEREYFRTGDLGYLKNGQLHVTGRLKDLIIVAGENHYPQDIERTLEASHELLRANSSAAFSVDTPQGERLVVVAEVDPRHRRKGSGIDFEEMRQGIRAAISQRHQLQAAEVVLIKAGTIPKTTSNKIQRSRCRELYLSGRLEPAL